MTTNSLDLFNLWIYNYEVTYYDSYEEKTINAAGLVLAKDIAEVFSRLNNYYFGVNSDDEFTSIKIEASQDGLITDNLVIELREE